MSKKSQAFATILAAVTACCQLAVAGCGVGDDNVDSPDAAVATAATGVGLPTPPGQAASGPGGADYAYARAEVVLHDVPSNEDLTYWTIEPRGWLGPEGSAPATAPLVVFLHGWGGNHPIYYAPWLDHLARKGNIIVFPRFQQLTTLDWVMTGNALWSLHAALGALQSAPIKPATWLGMTLVSHSVGALVAANIADRWQTEQLPVPVAMMFAMPFANPFVMDWSLAGIPATTGIDCVVGDEDNIAGRAGCDLIWSRTNHILAGARDYVWMSSDRHGSPGLSANHFAPNWMDALDWRGLWKLADGLRDCATAGINCEYAIGGGDRMTDLGSWSDGVAVKKLSVTTSVP